jgi:hypothetical protein
MECNSKISFNSPPNNSSNSGMGSRTKATNSNKTLTTSNNSNRISSASKGKGIWTKTSIIISNSIKISNSLNRTNINSLNNSSSSLTSSRTSNNNNNTAVNNLTKANLVSHRINKDSKISSKTKCRMLKWAFNKTQWWINSTDTTTKWIKWIKCNIICQVWSLRISVLCHSPMFTSPISNNCMSKWCVSSKWRKKDLYRWQKYEKMSKKI